MGVYHVDIVGGKVRRSGCGGAICFCFASAATEHFATTNPNTTANADVSRSQVYDGTTGRGFRLSSLIKPRRWRSERVNEPAFDQSHYSRVRPRAMSVTIAVTTIVCAEKPELPVLIPKAPKGAYHNVE